MPDPQIIRLPPEVRTVDKYPIISMDLLNCPEEPKVPSKVETDTDLAQWAQMVREAGESCRAKVGQLRGLVEAWPKNE